MPQIRIEHGMLDVVKVGDTERFAIFGQIDPASLSDIQVPDYQREVLSARKIAALQKAMKDGERITPVDLGMRGELHSERPKGTYHLADPVYVIDGLQRITAAQGLVQSGVIFPSLYALIHLHTNETWELKRFTTINTGQTGLNSNILLRNLAKNNEGARVMLWITSNSKFVLCDRVSWTQNMRKGDLLRATMYYKAVGRLMSWAGPGKSGPLEMANGGIDKMIAKVGRNVFIENVRTFFTLLDETFGVLKVAYLSQAVQLKDTFLRALAGVISDYENFWEGDRLAVPDDLKKRLATFPIDDPNVITLAGSAGQAAKILEALIVDHLNARKSTRRLRRRKSAEDLIENSNVTEGEEV